MSWLLHLYETYQTHQDQVGVIGFKRNEQTYTLLPIAHTTQNAHIEVLVTEDGAFHSASVLDKVSTLIPCTEDAANRAGSKVAPYPLHDKISYVAGDYEAHGAEVKGNEEEKPFPTYIRQLREWADSPYGTETVRSIYRYVSQGTLIADLVQQKVLHLDRGGKLIEKWDRQAEELHGPKPPIFGAIAGDPGSAFVRFSVYSKDKLLKRVWDDPEMYDSFIQFYQHRPSESDWCYVTGEQTRSTDKHANKIRHAADKAKLISANDTSGFTFRGRFQTGREAASIGYDVSQKAHNALKWLIQRQATVIDQRVFLVWGNEVLDIPPPTEDPFTINPAAVVEQAGQRITQTNEPYAAEVSKALHGYSNQLDDPKYDHTPVHILLLDSATTGRMAVLYYRSMDKQLYMEKLVQWHTTCTWLHRYRKDETGKTVVFYGAPATRDIAFAAYGPRASEKIVKGLMERMLPCVVDGRPVPLDIMQSVSQRASNPVSMDKWEWEKTLSIACALINKGERIGVSLDTTNTDRSYLFGRLLAVADVMERRALGEEERATNAIRYMNAFSRHPARTWQTIQASLQPYQVRLGGKATYYTKLIDEIASQFTIEQFNNKPLTQTYLLGLYSQRHALYTSKANKAEELEPTE